MLNVELCKERLRRACTWLTDVAQVRADGDVDADERARHPQRSWLGAFRGEYAAADRQWNSYCPVAHTGQGIKALLGAADVLGDSAYIQSAVRGAQFILNQRITTGDDRGLILAFADDSTKVSTSVMLQASDGLFALSHQTSDDRYAEVALEAVAWIQRKAVIAGKGLVRDLYDPATGSFATFAQGMEGRPLLDEGVFITAYRLTKRPEYWLTATQIAERLLADEGPPGNWLAYPPCNRRLGQIHPLHAYWWGRPMLAMHAELQRTIHPTSKDERFRQMFERCCDWYGRALRQDGGLFGNTYIDFSTDSFGQSTSGVAAATLMFLERFTVLHDATMVPWIERGLSYCMNMQFTSAGDSNLTGGLLEKMAAPSGTDASPYHVGDLGTILFVQAMATWLSADKTAKHTDVNGAFARSQTDYLPIPAPDEIRLHPEAELLPCWFAGATTVLDDGRLLMLDNGQAGISHDDGVTWQKRSIWAGKDAMNSQHSIIIRCRSGTLVFVFLDIDHQRLEWDNDKHALKSKPRLDVFAARSLDDGRTWSAPSRMYDGYCGCTINMIQTRSGRLVVPVQVMLDNPGRHAQTTFVSDDEGVTWRQSNMIDLGGHGHHDGAFESAVTQLGDGRLWMLIRTNLDRFWQAWSEDEGLSWRTITPTQIDASSAPPNLLRLQSGRLMLVWNRVYPEGLTPKQQAEWERSGGDRNACAVRSSWHRRELSIAFTEDDGAHWTPPLVLARGNQISYPHVFERRPGEVWLATQFGPRVSLRFSESALVAAAQAGNVVEGARA